MSEKPLSVRLRNFVLALGATLLFIYVFLPFLTRSVDILDAMARHLDETGIDPSRYYYTDVEQVAESERYLREVLKK
jgi:hypothetical protein